MSRYWIKYLKKTLLLGLLVSINVFYLQGVTEWDAALVDSAKGALIYSWAEKEETVSGLVTEANKAYRRGADSKYNRQFTVSIGDVTVEQIKEVAKRYFSEHFEIISSLK